MCIGLVALARRGCLQFFILTCLALPTFAPAQSIRLGSEFRVNTFIGADQFQPATAVGADGDFVVVWSDQAQADAGFDIHFAGSSSAGVRLFGEFEVVNSYTGSVQIEPAVAAEADGDFVVVWTSYFQEGYASGIFAQRFSSQGVPLAIEFQVNAYTVDYQLLPAVAIDAEGRYRAQTRAQAPWTGAAVDI